MKDKYSLWAVPSNESLTILQDLVDHLARENDAPAFIPHLTVVANIFASPQERMEIEKKIKELTSNIESFTASLTAFDFKDEEFRSLYLLAESPELGAVYQEVEGVFPQVRNEHFQKMPHMSVLYGNFSPDKKKAIIRDNQVLPLECKFTSFDLYLTNNPIDSWRLERVFPLR